MSKMLRCRTCDAEVVRRIEIGDREYGICDRCADRTPIRRPGTTTKAKSVVEDRPEAGPPKRRASREGLRIEARVTAAGGYREDAESSRIVVRSARARSGAPPEMGGCVALMMVAILPWSLALAAGVYVAKDMDIAPIAVVLAWLAATFVGVPLGLAAMNRWEQRSTKPIDVPAARLRVSRDRIEREEDGTWSVVAENVRDVRAQQRDGRYRVETLLEDGRDLVILDDLTAEESVEVEAVLREVALTRR